MPKSEDQVSSEPSTPPAQGEHAAKPVPPIEVGGRDGPEATRFGDWELRGRCIDF